MMEKMELQQELEDALEGSEAPAPEGAAEPLAREKAAGKSQAAEAGTFRSSQEWQALAQQLEARLAKLEPLLAQHERYKSALSRSLEAEKKQLPAHLLSLLEKLDPLEQVEYLGANRAELGLRAGVPASPSARERSLSEEDLEAARRSQANLYRNF